MFYRVPLLLILLLFVRPAIGQDTFSIEAYQAFLEANGDVSAEELRNRHDTGAFLEAINQPFNQAAFSSDVLSAFQLTSYETLLLEKLGFMVTERVSPTSFGDAYMEIYRNDLPVFLSTDAILHALHMSYNLILQETETNVLLPWLVELLEGLHGQLSELAETYADEPLLLQGVSDLDLYLSIPIELLTGNAVALYDPANAIARGELLQLIEQEQASSYGLFTETCRNIDFSQFTPRGHYTDSETLTRYFQAMIWLGRTELYLIAPETDQCAPTEKDVQRQTIMAALLAETLIDSDLESRLQDIDNLIAFFVGEQDNVTTENLLSTLDTAGVSDLRQLANSDTFLQFQNILAQEAFAFQRINSQILFSNNIMDPDRIKPAAAFMLLGQRFVIDSYITGHVVFNEVLPQPEPRMLPSSQDVLFALGNDASAQFLQGELQRFNYGENLEALRYLVDSYDTAFWESTFYNNWLASIRTLNPPKERTTLPAFMQTAGWWQEKMNSQLAAWAQLRHDNLLYAKQSYSGGIACKFPFSYVEPIPEFYASMSSLADIAETTFRNLADVQNLGGEYIADYFATFKGINDTLQVIATKELEEQPFSEAESEFLKRMIREEQTCGIVLDGWYTDLYFGGAERSQEPDLVVADIHTAPTDASGALVGWVLHVGTGPLNMAVVTAEVPGEGLMAFTGPVLSYYEHLSNNFDRLTDERWEEAFAQEPSLRPAFVNTYLADARGNQRGPSQTLATQTEPLPLPEDSFTLLAPVSYPNPFSSETSISFKLHDIHAYKQVKLAVYDVQGRLLKHVVNEALPAGNYTVTWDGTHEDGSLAASGVYFFRIAIGADTATRPTTLVR